MKVKHIINIGDTFGKWTVLGEPELRKGKEGSNHAIHFYPCKCSCGLTDTVWVNKYMLMSGGSTKCGCVVPFVVGMQFTRWTIVGEPKRNKNGGDDESSKSSTLYYPCKCSCGNERIYWIQRSSLNFKTSMSCGCLIREAASKVCLGRSNPKGWGSDCPIGWRWQSMISRCEDPKDTGYRHYGGRGITVCEEWHTYKVFETWALANGFEKSLWIERIDVNKGYSPENCKWATVREQLNNCRRTVYAVAFGEKKPTSYWADDPRCKVAHGTLNTRIRRGWDHGEAIITPSKFNRKPVKQPLGGSVRAF